MRQQRISFHFSKSDATHLLSSFNRLMCKCIVRSSSSSLRFIRHHMSESLIVHQAQIDINLHLDSLDARYHRLIPIVVVSMLHKFFSVEIHDVIVGVLVELLHIDVLSVEGASFAGETLNQHANCHSGGERMGVDNDVWSDSGLCEWHVFLGPNH